MTSRTIRALAGLGGLAVAIAVIPAGGATRAAAAPAAKAPLLVIGLHTPAGAKFTTSSGKHVKAEIDVHYLPQSHDGHTNIDLLTHGAAVAASGNPGFGEAHNWMFPMHGSDVLPVGKSGQAHLQLGAKQLGKFGSVNLTFAPSGAGQKAECGGGDYVVTYDGALTGRVHFDTRTGRQGWGVAAAKAGKLGFSTNITLVEGFGNGVATCFPHHNNPRACPVTVQWGNAAGGETYFVGGDETKGTRTVGYVTATRVAQLAKPKRTIRVDTLTVHSLAPTLTTGVTTTVDITTSGHGARGSATIGTASAPTPATNTCGAQNTSIVENQWIDGTFTNGTTPLAVHGDLYGPITATDDTTPASSIAQVAA